MNPNRNTHPYWLVEPAQILVALLLWVGAGWTRLGMAGRTDEEGTCASATPGSAISDAASVTLRIERRKVLMMGISRARNAVQPERLRQSFPQCRTRAAVLQPGAHSQPAHFVSGVEHDIDVA